MRLNSYIEKILKSEHIEIKRNFYERKEHEEWNEKVKIVQQLCDSDDVQFEVSTKFILTENGLQCESEERVVPVFKTKVDPLDNLKKILSKVGINPVKNTMYESIENHKWEKNVDLINNMIDADDFDFDVSTDMIFTEDNFKYESEQIIVPVMSKMEEKDASLNNNMMIMLNIDSVSYKEKPNDEQVAAIQNRIGGFKKTITVEEFMKAIENGSSFKAAALNGNKNVDWESQQVFALDIDNDEASIKKYGMLTPEEACNRFSDLGVSPVFYYSSFSSTEERPKFRLIFIVKNPITDIRVRNAIQMALMNIMPEADKACKDLSRLFFGTNKKCEVIYNQKQLLDPYMLIQSMVSWIKVRYSKSKNEIKHIKTYCERVGLNMINGLPNVQIVQDDKNYGNSASSIIYNIENAVNPYKNIVFHFCIDEIQAYTITMECKGKKNLKRVKISSEKIKYNKLIRNFPFHELETNKCRLWAEFITGDRWCYHQEIFGIACNMWRVEGAEQKMLNIIESNPKYRDKYNKIYTIKQCNKYGYAPMRCANFCPYHDNCSNQGVNMLHSIDNNRGSIRLVEDPESIKLHAAEDKLKKTFLEAYSDVGNIITIIRGATGVGKTTLLNTISNFDGLSISYPNHKLGEDIVSRIKISNSLHLKELKIDDKNVLNEFNRLQSIGAYKQARLYLEEYKNRIIEKKELYEIEPIDADKILKSIKDYFDNISKANTIKGTIFSTHKRMLELKNDNIKTYIIDEDILMSSIISTASLDIVELNNYINLSNRYEAKTITRCLNNLKMYVLKAMENPNRAFKIEKSGVNIKELNRIIQNESANLKVNLREIIDISSIVANDNGEVLGMTIGELPNKKCIILSATANENIYRSLFPNREIRFIDISNIETEGEIILHYTGFSRNKLSKEFEESIVKIRQETKGINNVITFCKFENKFKKAGFNPIAHFGACSGLDVYKGQDLIVVGTPHADERVYRLLAAIIEGEVENHQKISYTNAKKNGFEFYFNTYESGSLLQEIQFYFIESELIQAIGRARILRTDSKVHVFSNYPVRGAVLYEKKIS